MIFRLHAVQRMFQRSISEKDVKYALENGKIIEDYPLDYPYSSRLVLGWVNSRPLHIVLADNVDDGELIVITVYEPELSVWGSDFNRRKS